MGTKPLIVAEVKTRSPFGFASPRSWEELFTVAERTGDMLSIHIDPRWGGSFDLLARARAMTKKPILAKGIHANDDDIRRALDAGADWVLVVGRIPGFALQKCMLEPKTLAELAALPGGVRAVWNSRDLATGGRKNETFAEARELWKGWLCQASFIRSREDIHPDADAVLVGEHLETFAVSRDV